MSRIEGEFFKNDISGTDRIRFETKLEYKDNDQDGQFNNSYDEFYSVKLYEIDQYIWDI